MQETAWKIFPSDELPAQRNKWDRFLIQEGYPAFLRTSFLLHAILAFGFDDGYLAFGYREGALTAVALLNRRFPGRWQVFQPSQLPLGACAICTNVSWEEVLPSLLRALPGTALTISITQQDPKFTPRPNSGGQIEVIDYVPTAWIDISGSFEEFWQDRGKNLRQNLRKQRRKLEEQGTSLRFEFLQGREEIDAVFLDFAKIESSGWKAEAGSAIAAPNKQGRFYRQMLGDFARDNMAFGLRLSLDNQPIAVDFGLMDSTSMVILKTTYDESLKGLSPGQLLHERALEYLFERKPFGTVEFYGKVMEWHTRWTEKSRQLFHLNYFRSSIVRRVRDILKKSARGN